MGTTNLEEVINRAHRRKQEASKGKVYSTKDRDRALAQVRADGMRVRVARRVEKQRKAGAARWAQRAEIGTKLGVNPKRVIIDFRTGQYIIKK